MQIQVTKRDGHKESLDLEKLHKVVFWATEGITGVSASEVEIKSHIQFYNGIKTADIQETLIKSAADLISEETPNYQYVAGRLINYHLRKQVYGDYDPWHLLQLVKQNVESGFYDQGLLDAYNDAEWDKLNSILHHERDEHFTYVAMEQWRGKYLVQNRVTNEIFETPQIAYLLIAATLFQNYPKETRLQWVKDYYDSQAVYSLKLTIAWIALMLLLAVLLSMFHKKPELESAQVEYEHLGVQYETEMLTTRGLYPFTSCFKAPLVVARKGVSVMAPLHCTTPSGTSRLRT